LKAGEQVVVGSTTLLSAFIAAGLPEQHYRQFCYGGRDYHRDFVLDGQDRLSEWAPEVEIPSPARGIDSERRVTDV
jgi:hypothetical protein